MRHQFVLDKKRNKTLDRLSSDGLGSRSAIVRRGIDLVAEEEAILDATEADPGFIRMMEESERAIREGRFMTLDEAIKSFRAAKRAEKEEEGLMARVIVPIPILEILHALPAREGEAIFARFRDLERFPRMYSIWTRSRRFRRHRSFVEGHWRVFHRVTDDTVWIRGIWPARMPVRLSLVKNPQER